VALAVLASGLVSPMHAQADAAAPKPLAGHLVPTFAWPDMDDSTAIISPVSLQGRVVLIDLWATWCTPCRREMPFLHDAHTRFRARGLDILSVSFDLSPGKVTAYRRDSFPMPWLHVYADAAIEGEARRLFRVDSFPRTILIDRDGTVLRVDVGLRGPTLLATLDSVLTGHRIERR
jgi:thiol-disulfide isomerase/thioredoxin